MLRHSVSVLCRGASTSRPLLRRVQLVRVTAADGAVAASVVARRTIASHAAVRSASVLPRTLFSCRCAVFARHAAKRAGAAVPLAARWPTHRALMCFGLPGAVGAVAFGMMRSGWKENEVDVLLEDIELPPIPEPELFVHPYSDWSWCRRTWFTIKRSVFLAWVFAPFMYASTIVLIFPDSKKYREYWLDKMLQCTQNAGAAFQKFGQWLSMRPDMFPPDVIEVLSRLRADAPSHSPEFSKNVLRDQLGRDVDELFDQFEEEPVASGSVGQVHRARLRPEFALDGKDGKLRDVAVKIRHPGVADSAFMDLDIVWKIVELSETFIHMTLPFNRGEFDEVIQRQMDFTREAHNLQKFSRNFKGERRIRFPKVSRDYVTREVLVETWADGKIISNILEDFDNATSACKEKFSSLVQAKRELQGKLRGILYDMSMKMMVRDNFVHGDLHGGNILYSEKDNHVTVLDAGIATSLDKDTVAPFGKFLHALCSGHTDNIVKYLQYFNESTKTVKLSEFRQDIQAIMDKFMGPLRANPELPVNAADMFGEVMFSMQRHCMLMKGDVASTLFTISISEGLIRQLDPTFDVATSAIPYIVKHMPALFTSTSEE